MIKLISVWVGDKLPPWMPQFRRRMEANYPLVSWQLVQFPDMESARARCQATTGYECRKATPYSLCDLRPAYAAMFPELYVGADFWGWCDLDIVVGDLTYFLTPGLLQQYDVLTGASYLVDGPFAIFRNNTETRTLYRGPAFAEACAAPELRAFDEKGFTEIVKLSGLKYLFGDWSSHDRHRPPRACMLTGQGRTTRGGWTYGHELVEIPGGKRLAYFHFPGGKRWPLS